MIPLEVTTQQSAHFARAGKIRLALVAIQLIITVPGAIAVVLVSDRNAYILAFTATALTISWWFLKIYYDRVRSVAQAARRAGLIANSLPGSLSPIAMRNLDLSLLISQESAKKFENANYYASNLLPGWERLADNIEESAFYTSKLQADCASLVKFIVYVFVSMMTVLTFYLIGSADGDYAMKVTRVALAFSIFILSGDIFGSFRLHSEASRSASEICQRLGQMRGHATKEDVLLALLDYSSVVESAPESLPFVYRFRQSHLDRMWKDYQKSM